MSKFENKEKIRVKEAIVVEGRDDTNAVMQGVDGITIETHGFGIRKETWELLEKAYREKGLIIFTDPDFSGEEIRKKITARFPESKQAYLTRKEAEKKGDIGIENASAEDIIEAIKKAEDTNRDAQKVYTEDDMFEAGLIGLPDSKERRQKLGAALGIGYSNGKSFIKKLNQFEISREDFEKALNNLKAL